MPRTTRTDPVRRRLFALIAGGLGGVMLGLWALLSLGEVTRVAIAVVCVGAAVLLTWLSDRLVSSLARDVSDARLAEERSRWHAYHDTLTGLPNRIAFQEELGRALARAARSGESMAVAFLDLDGFKEVNDTLGHDGADRLLVEVTARLRTAIRATDFVARQGGDEFLVLSTGLRSVDAAPLVARRILDALRAPFVLDGRQLHVGGSVGIALSPADGTDAATLVKHADLAMYQAKEAGRGSWHLFDPALHARAARVQRTRASLARALQNGDFGLVYQPQVDLRTRRIVGVEALLRWNSPEGVVSPMDFIPIAEQTGLISEIGAWVLKQACSDAARWSDAGLPPVRVAVNLSARQFMDGALVTAVNDALAASGLHPRRLELEITETIGLRDPERVQRALSELRRAGVSVALDDFGTGHSSLSYLRLNHIDRLKIDRTFLADTRIQHDTVTLVDAMVRVAHALGMEVVAEGVETAEQLELLHRQGCDLVQGFYLFRPMGADEIVHVLEEESGVLASA